MLGITDLFKNIKGDVQDKSKNPFFGAFLVTWAIRNWQLFFEVFDHDSKSSTRIEVIEAYFKSLPPYHFWITIALTFGVIVMGYVFLNLARVISNISEKILTPLIYKWTAGKVTIVLKEEYDRVLLREDRLKVKLIKEKSERQLLEDKFEKFESKKIELIDDKLEVSQYTKSFEEIQKDSKNDEIIKINSQYKKLKKSSLIDTFKKNSAEILSGIELKKRDEDISNFLTKRLIRFVQDVNENHGTALFELTDLGNKVLDKINYEEENTF